MCLLLRASKSAISSMNWQRGVTFLAVDECLRMFELFYNQLGNNFCLNFAWIFCSLSLHEKIFYFFTLVVRVNFEFNQPQWKIYQDLSVTEPNNGTDFCKPVSFLELFYTSDNRSIPSAKNFGFHYVCTSKHRAKAIVFCKLHFPPDMIRFIFDE